MRPDVAGPGQYCRHGMGELETVCRTGKGWSGTDRQEAVWQVGTDGVGLVGCRGQGKLGQAGQVGVKRIGEVWLVENDRFGRETGPGPVGAGLACRQGRARVGRGCRGRMVRGGMARLGMSSRRVERSGHTWLVGGARVEPARCVDWGWQEQVGQVVSSGAYRRIVSWQVSEACSGEVWHVVEDGPGTDRLVGLTGLETGPGKERPGLSMRA